MTQRQDDLPARRMYRWPEDVIDVLTTIEGGLTNAQEKLEDLETLARAHHAEEPAERFNDAVHDLVHALAHLGSVRRTLQLIFGKPADLDAIRTVLEDLPEEP